MEKINTGFLINIENPLIYILNRLNYWVYILEWPLILLGLIIAIILILRNKKTYSYRYELSKWLKISLFMIVVAYFIKVLNLKGLTPIFDTIFYYLMPITILTIYSIYLLDKCIFYKFNNMINLRIRYLNYIIVTTYTFLLISSMYGVKDIILPSIWQIVLISVKFAVENKKDVVKNKECVLYETRAKQLSILKDIIKNSNYENYAISINGEWGSGKSELISALISECERDNNYYVYIKPMVSDTQESLIREFQKSISKIMKSNGIYSGRNSSLDKYFKEILKLVQFNNKVTLSDFIDLTNEEDSYKDLKKELQNDLDLLLNKNIENKRLIVIIDDFDRVEENKQLEILSFIKEVIDFDGCVTIIALDYENLKSNEIVNSLYLEKFIATQIPLVDMEFHEIIKFHAEDILEGDLLKNSFSQKILREINNNIYDYYDNIDARIVTYYNKKDEYITKSNDKVDGKEKDKSELEKFLKFSIEKRGNIDNSRRIIHFLKEIKNTITLIDQLYEERDYGEELLRTVNVSEIVYFFNYLKVFYNSAYESIIKLKGIEEYNADLNRKDKKLEEEYFKVILGDIIPETSRFFTNEEKELSRRNSLNLIKDIFINYHFSKNNIELLTNSQKCLDEIDSDAININENFIENTQVYQDAIFKYTNDEEKIIKRIKSLINYILNLYEQKEIGVADILQIATYKTNYRGIKYTEYYLKEVCKLIDEGKVNKIYEKDRRRIESSLRDFEMDNIVQYKYIIVELLVIATLDKNNDGDIDKLFKDLMENNKLFERIKKYSIDNHLIQEKDNITDLSELLYILFRKVKNTNYIVIDLELLHKRLEEFLVNYKYINKLKKIKINVDSVDRYKQLLEYFNIENINEAREVLEDLTQKEVIDSNMLSCFQKLIKIVLRENEVDEKCKSNIITIFKKLRKEDCWNEYAWFDIMVNVERVLSHNEGIEE